MRTKRTVLIFLTDVIPLVIISLIGIFKLKIFINVLGDETLGLYQLFSQIMIYIGLVDGGLSNAVLHALYKPNIEKDEKTLYSILLGAKRAFAIIGIIVFLLSFLISFFVPFFIKNNSFNNYYMSFTFLLFAISNVFSYFFVSQQVLLEVKEKKYIYNLCTQIGQIVQGILEITLLLCGFSFIDVLLIHIIVKFLSGLIMAIIANKKYKSTYKSLKPNYNFLKQIKHLLFHKINGLVGSNIDILILSKLLGLGAVAIYSVYNYIGNMLCNIVGKFSSSVIAIMGNYMEQEKNKIYPIFKEINNMMFFIAIIICVPLAFAFDSFINIWYEGSITTSFSIAIAFSSLLFINIIIQSVCTFVNSAGLFKETKVCSITDTILNLILSLLLVNFFGIPGVIFATVVSMLIAQYIMKGNVIYKNVFEENPLTLYKDNIKFILIILVDFIIGLLIFKHFVITNIFIWLLVFVIYFMINSMFVSLLFYILKSFGFINRVKILLNKK